MFREFSLIWEIPVKPDEVNNERQLLGCRNFAKGRDIVSRGRWICMDDDVPIQSVSGGRFFVGSSSGSMLGY